MDWKNSRCAIKKLIICAMNEISPKHKMSGYDAENPGLLIILSIFKSRGDGKLYRQSPHHKIFKIPLKIETTIMQVVLSLTSTKHCLYDSII